MWEQIYYPYENIWISALVAAVGLAGRENELFKFTIKISVIFLIVVGILNLIINL